MTTAAAFWVTEPGRGQIRPVTLPEPGPDEVLVRTLRTGLPTPTGTIVLALVPLILGFQLLLQGIVLDIEETPK